MTAQQDIKADSWTVAGRTFSSRLIVGTGKYKSLEENAAAADVSLSAVDVARLDERFSSQAVSGDRSWPLMKKWLDQG